MVAGEIAMPANTTLVITPVANEKRVLLSGTVAVGELVAVTLVNCQAFEDSGLRIRIRRGTTEIARFPLAAEDTWTSVAGSLTDTSCTLNLNTVQAQAIFDGKPDKSCVGCMLVVEMTDEADLTLTAVSAITLRNWPKAVGDSVPYDLTGWADDLAAIEAAVDALEGSFDDHAHTGADGIPAVAHGDLEDIGTKTHAELESEDDALGVLIDAVESDVETAQADIVTNTEKIAGHAHTGADGTAAVSHANLTDKGTRTHAQLESDIGAVDDKADANAGLLAAHAHTGADGSVAVAAASLTGYAALLARLEAAEAAVEAQQTVLDALAATYLAKPVTANYTVTAPTSGEYRNIRENMTGDELARCVPTIVQDLIDRGVL